VGLFKDMKNMKDMVNAAPETIATAQQMGAQAQELAAAQQAAAAAQMASFQAPGATPGAPAVAGGPDFEPVAGVSLELYAEISRELAASGYDQSQAVQLAASKGVSAENWQAALDGWNGRMKTNPAVGQQFNRLYTAG
jgi:hypothetical protein